LAICKGNAHLLGGDIHVVSEPGKGSTFYFTLKYDKGDSNSVKPEIQKSPLLEKNWKSKEILLVEDDISTIEYLKHLLSFTGIKLHIARSGNEVEEFYKKLTDINLVLLDLRLPDANGLDLLRQIKTLKKELPVIAQTAQAMENDKLKCLEAGFDDYIAKPFKREQIMNLINSYME
jgi:CheY-like chemotaxis protein